ncbi:MAG TPA: hypothetical protein VFT74_10755, partial [Isosphaeraceae bacterium]|nr:hypothetical protein [Isosphaeraceae bacterium]
MGAPLLWLMLLVPSQGPAPLEVGNRKQLFLDNRFLAQSERISLQMNPAQKLGLLRDENGQPLQGHVSRVIEDGGKIRLYLGHENVEILESDDGLQFRRTGDRISGGIFPTIFLDPHDPDPARKYKLFRLRLSAPFDPVQDGVYG